MTTESNQLFFNAEADVLQDAHSLRSVCTPKRAATSCGT